MNLNELLNSLNYYASSPDLNNSCSLAHPIVNHMQTIYENQMSFNIPSDSKNKLSPIKSISIVKDKQSLFTHLISPLIKTPFIEFNKDREQRIADFKNIRKDFKTTMLPYTSSCRFEDILCPESTVALKTEKKYLHANLVTTPNQVFCATQYPYEEDVLFWDHCFTNGHFIVDLTNPRDSMTPYTPEKKEVLNCKKKFTIQESDRQLYQLSDGETIDKMTCYTYLLTNIESNQSKEIKRIHYQGWLDGKGTTAFELQQLITHLSSNIKTQSTKECYPIIHCRAGVGRTGTLISLLILNELVNQGEISLNNSEEELKKIVKDVIEEVRKARGPVCVQTADQYSTILDTLELLLKKD